MSTEHGTINAHWQGLKQILPSQTSAFAKPCATTTTQNFKFLFCVQCRPIIKQYGLFHSSQYYSHTIISISYMKKLKLHNLSKGLWPKVVGPESELSQCLDPIPLTTTLYCFDNILMLLFIFYISTPHYHAD